MSTFINSSILTLSNFEQHETCYMTHTKLNHIVIPLSSAKNLIVLSIMEPILSNELLMNIPKLVIGQFCRGNSMEYTCNLDWPFPTESSVNLQESDFQLKNINKLSFEKVFRFFFMN